MEGPQEKRQEREEDREDEGAFRCEHCGSDTYEDVAKAALWRENGLVVIEDIPARVCERCGEQFFDQEISKRIEKLIADPPVKPKQKIFVPVFSLAEVEVPESGSRPEVLNEEEIEAVGSMFTGTEQGGQEGERNQESQEAYLCKYCESDTYEGLVKSVLWGERGLVAIENIPARVCQQCKEQFYDEETTRKIANLTERGFPAEKARREILVPVFSLREVEVRKKKSPFPERRDDR